MGKTTTDNVSILCKNDLNKTFSYLLAKPIDPLIKAYGYEAEIFDIEFSRDEPIKHVLDKDKELEFLD